MRRFKKLFILFMFLFTFLIPSLNAVHASSVGYTVSGGNIFYNGKLIQLRGVNWAGFDGWQHVAGGLGERNYVHMIQQMKTSGFNAVRVPLCPDTFHGSWVNGINYALNPDLGELNSQGVLDKVLNELNNQGMYILLDFHSTDCYSNSDKWNSWGYSTNQWVSDLTFLAQRYSYLNNFIGIDLKNEPHQSASWGTGDINTDFKLASEKAGESILNANPNLLIYVDGIGSSNYCTDNSYSLFWGENLQPINCDPITAISKDKLVLSPHIYGPSVYPQWYFYTAAFPNNMSSIWDQHFGLLIKQGYTLIPGEWGGKYIWSGGSWQDIQWMNTLISYMESNHICNSFFWSWNANSYDTGGILLNDWMTVSKDKMDLLNNYFNSCR